MKLKKKTLKKLVAKEVRKHLKRIQAGPPGPQGPTGLRDLIGTCKCK